MSAAGTMHNERTLSGALALAMHVLFFILLVFGVSWQRKPESPVMADLWSSLPPLPQPKVDLPPEPEPPRVEPKPIPKVEAAPPPKVEPKPVPKPDIAVKHKVEKEKKKEPPPKAEPKKRDEAKEKADEKAKAAEKAKAEKLKLEKEAEAKKQTEEKERELKKFLAEKEANAQASAQDKLVNEYMRRIKDKIEKNVVVEARGNPVVEFDVVVIPGGDVLGVKLRRSSGNSAYDAAVERAIVKSQPLPLPPNPELFSRFRDLHLIMRHSQ